MIGLSFFGNVHLIRLDRKKQNLFEWQPREQAWSYGHMESAHEISLLSIFEETSMIEWSLQAHGCVWPDFKINFKNTIDLCRSNSAHAPMLDYLVFINDLILLLPCVSICPPEHAYQSGLSLFSFYLFCLIWQSYFLQLSWHADVCVYHHGLMVLSPHLGHNVSRFHSVCVQQIPLGQLSLTYSAFQVANFEERLFLFVPSPSSPLLSDKWPWLTSSFHKQKTCLPLILQHRPDLCVWVNIHDILPDHALYHHLCCFSLQVTLHHVLYQCKCEWPHPTKCTPSSPSTGASPAFTMSPGYTTSTLLCTLGEGTSSSSPPTLPLPLPPPLLVLQMLQTPRNLHLLALPEDMWGSNPCTFAGEIMFNSPEDQHGNHCIVFYIAMNSLASTRVLLTPFDGLGTGVLAPEECQSLV